jgi:hypothetical protein
MLDLENLNLVELNAQEVQEVEGGMCISIFGWEFCFSFFGW